MLSLELLHVSYLNVTACLNALNCGTCRIFYEYEFIIVADTDKQRLLVLAIALTEVDGTLILIFTELLILSTPHEFGKLILKSGSAET